MYVLSKELEKSYHSPMWPTAFLLCLLLH